MEYLDQSEWETLDIFMNTSSIVLSSTKLQKVPKAIVSALKSKNYVHGNLWYNNIMIWKDLLPYGTEAKNQRYYPGFSS